MDDKGHTPLSPRDLLILLALGERPLHGYGLVKETERLSDGEVRMDPANLYRAIRRLLRDGLVEECDGRRQQQRRGPQYGLTALGRSVAGSELERLERLTHAPVSRKLLRSTRGRSR